MAENKESLLNALKASEAFERNIEDVFHYASLMASADQGDSKAQEMKNRAMMAYTKASDEQSFFLPELMQIDDAKIAEWLKDSAFDDYRVHVQKLFVRGLQIGVLLGELVALRGEQLRLRAAAH